MLGSGLYLYCNLFSVRGTPFLLGGDEQVFWMDALRMLQGELIYRDFFEFTPPGTDLVYFSAFGLLGARIWVPNLIQLLLGISLSCVCFHIARCVMKTAPAVLATALFLVLTFGRWLDATHHWFSVLAVMMAVIVLLRGSSASRVVICGALLGLASFFTQTRGVGAGVGIGGFLLVDGIHGQLSVRSHFEQLLRLLLAALLTWVVLDGYFILRLGISKLFYFQVAYVLKYVTNEAHNIYPQEHDPFAWPLRNQVVYFGTPIIYAISLWRCRRTARAGSFTQARPIALLAMVGVGLFLEVAASPNWLRVDCVLLPAFILLAWLVAGLAERLPEPRRWQRYATVLTWLGLAGLGAHQAWARNVTRPMIVQLPAGRTAVTHPIGEKLTWLAQRTTPGELFFQAGYQSLYLPLHLRDPAFDFLDRYTSPEFVALDLRQLAAQRVHYILWSPLARPRYPQFEQFLFERYRRVWRFPDGDEIWELRCAPPENCMTSMRPTSTMRVFGSAVTAPEFLPSVKGST
jgi:hypothetical protein